LRTREGQSAACCLKKRTAWRNTRAASPILRLWEMPIRHRPRDCTSAPNSRKFPSNANPLPNSYSHRSPISVLTRSASGAVMKLATASRCHGNVLDFGRDLTWILARIWKPDVAGPLCIAQFLRWARPAARCAPRCIVCAWPTLTSKVDLCAVVPPDAAASTATLMPFLLDPAAGLPRGSPAVSACVEAAATFLRGAGLAVQEAPLVASCARSRDLFLSAIGRLRPML
jgi:hypothetical protein